MDWQRFERWATVATIALYVAAAASLVIMLGESLLPEGSPAQRAFHDIADYLNRLGDIGSGMIVVVILFILVGGGTVMLLLKAYDQFQENRKRRARERAEAAAEGRAEGLAEGRAEGLAEGLAEGRAEGLVEGLALGRAEIIDQLRERGISPDELVVSDETEPEDPGNHGD